MKKLFLCAAFAAFAFTNVNAQEVKFGAKAGLNLATIGGDFEDAESLTSFHIGGVAEIMISDKFSVQPELLYNSVGASTDYTESFEGVTVNAEGKIKLNYISLPIMAKYYVAEGFSVEAGPQIGFLMSANEEYEVSGGGFSESGDEDVKDNFKSIDFGFGIGAGYKMESGLNFALRYNLGLSNIAEDAGDDFSAQNNVFQVSVGYTF
ncbi:porin family protein [Winogradskyella thalassocola]|uniref:Outer membrane protein beta-barrel domain-containing protein n=1 Tax=Winogradskyella thalassocola TaxID=262004 RepID=A0A1G8L3M7_9FLAO|nr:porin family protein [Winogradskyella thalassocola]SDI50211.1 Outer membrane protein beta-barrel domain-containing protein [Winogradskyella thalassocola]